jgi:hypothetical protein
MTETTILEQDLMVTVSRIQRALQAEGLAAVIEQGNDGIPRIRSGVLGARFWLYLSPASKNGEAIRSVQFRARWNDEPATPNAADVAAKYNAEYRFGKAYYEADDHAFTLEMDAITGGGVTDANLGEVVSCWCYQVETFLEFIRGKSMAN